MASRGIVRTNKFLSQIADEFGEDVKNAGVAELAKGAEKIKATAKSLCPALSGKLKESIHVETKKSKKGANIKVVADAKNNGFPYGRIVEFSPKIQRPFMIPAKDEHAMEIRENALDAIRQAIRRKWKK